MDLIKTENLTIFSFWTSTSTISGWVTVQFFHFDLFLCHHCFLLHPIFQFCYGVKVGIIFCWCHSFPLFLFCLFCLVIFLAACYFHSCYCQLNSLGCINFYLSFMIMIDDDAVGFLFCLLLFTRDKSKMMH